jgi:hypothetical protein
MVFRVGGTVLGVRLNNPPFQASSMSRFSLPHSVLPAFFVGQSHAHIRSCTQSRRPSRSGATIFGFVRFALLTFSFPYKFLIQARTIVILHSFPTSRFGVLLKKFLFILYFLFHSLCYLSRAKHHCTILSILLKANVLPALRRLWGALPMHIPACDPWARCSRCFQHARAPAAGNSAGGGDGQRPPAAVPSAHAPVAAARPGTHTSLRPCGVGHTHL